MILPNPFLVLSCQTVNLSEKKKKNNNNNNNSNSFGTESISSVTCMTPYNYCNYCLFVVVKFFFVLVQIVIKAVQEQNKTKNKFKQRTNLNSQGGQPLHQHFGIE